MAKRKDKNYRRKIEALKAQLATYTPKEQVTASPAVPVGSSKQDGEPLMYTSVEVVKKDLIKTLILTAISFALIAAAYYFRNRFV